MFGRKEEGRDEHLEQFQNKTAERAAPEFSGFIHRNEGEEARWRIYILAG